MATLEIPTETSPLIAVPPRTSLPDRVGLTTGAILLLFFAFQVFASVHDDAFITYRYAYNLRHGLGPVFNAGEHAGEHTEGYSCPLYMALTALGMFVPGDVLFKAKLFGLACALATLWVVWRLTKEMELPSWACAAAPLVLGASSSFAFSAVDGMETAFQALLVTAAALSFVREQKTGRGWASSFWLLAAALNRPEGVLFFLAALVALVIGQRQAPHSSDIAKNQNESHGRADAERSWREAPSGSGVFSCEARRVVIWLVVFIIPMMLFLLWRRLYYGDWLPNTFYAKTMPLETALDLHMGPAYLLRTLFPKLNDRVIPILISGALWLLAMGGAVSERIRRAGALVLPLFVLVQALVALRAGGDWMSGWRYMAAVTPI